MIKNIVIFLLSVYSAVMTIKFLEADFKYQKLKKRFEEIQIIPRTDTIRVYEVKVKRDTIIKYLIKREFKLDTIYVYEIGYPVGENYAVFNWNWKNFLTLKDTFFVRYDSTQKNLIGRLYRNYRVEQPVKVDVILFEKKPFDLWWKAFVFPYDMAQYVQLGLYSDLKKYHFFSGAGIQFDEKIYPTLNFAVLYDRHLFGVDVSLKNISFNYKLAIK